VAEHTCGCTGMDVSLRALWGLGANWMMFLAASDNPEKRYTYYLASGCRAHMWDPSNDEGSGDCMPSIPIYAFLWLLYGGMWWRYVPLVDVSVSVSACMLYAISGLSWCICGPPLCDDHHIRCIQLCCNPI
jgi:hypothetical protein